LKLRKVAEPEQTFASDNDDCVARDDTEFMPTYEAHVDAEVLPWMTTSFNPTQAEQHAKKHGADQTIALMRKIEAHGAESQYKLMWFCTYYDAIFPVVDAPAA
jgi:hypothetical protein